MPTINGIYFLSLKLASVIYQQWGPGWVYSIEVKMHSVMTQCVKCCLPPLEEDMYGCWPLYSQGSSLLMCLGKTVQDGLSDSASATALRDPSGISLCHSPEMIRKWNSTLIHPRDPSGILWFWLWPGTVGKWRSRYNIVFLYFSLFHPLLPCPSIFQITT